MAVLTPALRALAQMIFPRSPRRLWYPGRLTDERNYEQIVGDGTGSSLVDTLISFIIHGFTQMYPVVARSLPDEIDSTELLPSHPAAALFRRPVYDPELGYSWYSWMTMIAGLVTSFIADGNSYLLKVRGAGGFGRPAQIWYAPHYMLEPRWNQDDPRRFITSYDYAPSGVRLTEGPIPIGQPNGPVFSLRPQDVIHLRDGIDPQNPRKGFSKLKKLLREIYTDEEAARFTASLLRNQGVPGIVVSPATDKGWIAEKDDREEIKRRIAVDYTADRRGEPIVLSGPAKVEQYGFSPEAMRLRDIRAIPEERISAAIGIPAAVAGFGAGLEHTKVGRTMVEFVDLAWQNGILPRARVFAAEFTEQYLSEWEPGAGVTHDFAFDTQRVPIMAEYHKLVAERHEVLVRSSIEDRGAARRSVGLPASSRDNVFILQAGMTEVPSDKTLDQVPTPTVPGPNGGPAPAPKPGASRNGNGNGNGGDRVPLDETEVVAGS